MPLTILLVGIAKVFTLGDATYARLIVLWVAFASYSSGFVGFCLLSRWRGMTSRRATAYGALMCGVVAAVNPWTIARLEHSWLIAQWAVLPLVVGTFAEGVRTRRKTWLVGSALIMAIFGSTQPHYLLITTVLVFGLGFVLAFRGGRFRGSRLIDLGIWSLALLATSAYFIAPYVAVKMLGGNPDPAYTLMDQTLISTSRFQDLPGSLLGTGNFNWQDVVAPSGPERVGWSLAAWVVAVLPLAVLFASSRRGPALFVAAAGYGVALVAAASHWTATAEIYQFMVNNIPGFWVLREPDRAVGVTVWSQALAAGMAITSLASSQVRLPQSLIRWGVAGYIVVAIGIHAGPAAAAALWGSGGPDYVPQRFPDDYRQVLRLVDGHAGESGRVLVVSSDERIPDWDETRILRLIEAASLASPSLTGDTRSPVPPSPVAGRWFEYFGSLSGDEMAAAARQAGLDHVVVVRDNPAGAAIAARIAQADGVGKLAAGPNLWAGTIGQTSPRTIEARLPTLVTTLGAPVGAAGAAVLANHSASRGADHLGGQTLEASSAEAVTDWSFGQLGSPAIRSVTDWFGFRGRRGRWVRGGAYADERQALQGSLARLGIESWSADYGLGIAFAPPGDAADALEVDTTAGRGGATWLRILTSPASDWMDITWTGGTRRIETRAPTTRWLWTKIEGMEADSIAIVPGPGLSAVNAVAFTPPEWSPVENGAATEFVLPEISYSKVTNTEYVANIKGPNGQAFLLLREAYDPLWRGYTNGQVVKPVLTDGLWNGYVVRVDGPTSISFRYSAARWYDAGIVISLASAATLLLFGAAGRMIRVAGAFGARRAL